MTESVKEATRPESLLVEEQTFYNELEIHGSKLHDLLHRMSCAFYEKGRRGRIWSHFWNTVDLPGAKVLDYGCGDGSFSHILASHGAHVYGIDLSPQRIMQAKAATNPNHPGRAEFFVGDAHQTPFPDNTFDLVVGNGALHHLDLERAYAEISRVLKPRGRAFFMEPMFFHPALRLLRFLTPSLRSPGEKPLDFADMRKAERWYRNVVHYEHFLFAAFAAPCGIFGKNFALAMIAAIDDFDQILMRLLPGLREQAWLTMLELEK